jgi:hypothetical protein
VQSILRKTTLALSMLLCVCIVRAQEPETPEPPVQERARPAARGIPPISEPDNANEQSDTSGTTGNWQPDATPLTGLQTPSLGNPDLRHSYWVPGLQYSANVQSRALGAGSSADWFVTHYVGGSLSLLKAWSHSQLALNYSGGGVFTTQPGESNGSYQQLGIGQNVQWRRLQLQWTDQFSYLPQTQFGFGGSTGLGLPGIGGSLGPTGPGLGSLVVPSQSIYEAQGPRYSNAALVQMTYLLGPRHSLTAAGSYGLLHFTQSGNVDMDDVIGSLGYNYVLSSKDTIGLVYRFTAYHYQGEPQALGDMTVSFAYGRKITRRLALQIFAGPDYTTYRVPIGTDSRRVSGSGSVDLKYGFRQSGLGLGYTHGLAGGSGVLTGSVMDQVTFSANHRLTRVWSVNGTFGFASNRALSNSVGGAPSVDLKNWYLGGGITRPFGRNVDFSLAYTASISQPNQPACTGVNCNASYTQHTITVFLQWHTRPFVIE